MKRKAIRNCGKGIYVDSKVSRLMFKVLVQEAKEQKEQKEEKKS